MDMRSLIHQSSSSNSSSSATVNSSSTNSSFSAPIVSSAVPAPPFAVMRSQPTIFQRSAVPSTVSQTSTLAPLRFIIPNGNSFSHNGAGFPASVPSTNQSTFNMHEPEREPQPNHSMLYPRDCMKTEQQELSPTLNDQKQPKKMMPKRTRTPKLSSRSTKSKARPGLRKGKWTEEESRYAAQLTSYFKEGLLPLERGTMLRLYLSQKLNCEPMRITKKFTGGECIGKQVFRPCSLTPESRVRIMQAQLELVALEAAFIKRLKENREDPPDELDVRPTSFGHRSRPVPLKPRHTGMYEPGDDDKEGDVEDANAVGLLLDFFYKANRNEKKRDKKAGVTKKDESSAEDIRKEIEGAQIKKESTEISTPTSPATNSESDTSVISPTKRMRALSVSGCVDPAASKRSRVGSFSTCPQQ
ncbi:hypothetical protein KXD40_008633 [Peronospora effusa]|uniref:Uncharacterized protein n=1 Tax=Peronospora effusa TaxID=542832 RepID=A0A3M6V812_9STRA|nr:hypothetical protein DD238_004313 [Peronospora effusa]RQM09703.1 hypothetical protein DD237_006293 [Peronospora effusa]UIZ24438.1 hypothetical protein KXD40_008633 [Peronospora effusa]CAI5701027.1 unnamed protein product [Peronospora effusa]